MKRIITLLLTICFTLLNGTAFSQVQSPAITLSADSLGLNVIQWTDDPYLQYDTYNLYASRLPITDQSAEGVVKIASFIPGGEEIWRHRPYTHDGLQSTYYYAMTISHYDGSETPIIDGVSNGGPLVNSTSQTMKALYDPNFGLNFSIDGNLNEFQVEPYSNYTIFPENVVNNEGQAANWNLNSSDINFEATFVVDDYYLYLGAFVKDDDPSGGMGDGSSWEGDSFELFIGLYNVRSLTARHSISSLHASGEDWRIAFMSDGRTQAEGWYDYTYPGMDYGVNSNQSPKGYIIEARIDLNTLALGYNPSVGDYLPLNLNAVDQDPLQGDNTRSLIAYTGGSSGNHYAWMRPSCWGYLEVVTGSPLEQIKAELSNNPPNTGDPIIRENCFLSLDDIFADDSCRTSQSVINFYTSMIDKVNLELQEDVTGGAAIWMMYNHGFVVKTRQVTFAFDLVDGYIGWGTVLPSELLEEIEVLFISHEHGDHYDQSVLNSVLFNGGYVVVPAEQPYIIGNVRMLPGDELDIAGLHIKAYDGLHGGTISRIFEVICPNGIKIMHTGDNQTPVTLPVVDNLDILLLNGWVSESSSSSSVDGMRSSIYKLQPKVMIPGHFHEFMHEVPRIPIYAWAFEVDDVPIPSEVQVLAWGEQYFFEGGSYIPQFELYPQITSISDVDNDQGRQVRISWRRSKNDVPESEGPIINYTIWRKIDPDLSPVKQFSNTISNASGDWDFVASVPAVQDSFYHTVVATLKDSTINQGMVWSTFLVRAHTDDPFLHWESPPDSGYSIDNLIPSPPTNLLAAAHFDTVFLDWDDPIDDDFDFFTIYRGSESNFNPNLVEPIGFVSTPHFIDMIPYPATYYYRIAAIDFSGNMSNFSDEVSVIITSVTNKETPSTPDHFQLIQNYPNPFNPMTTIEYSLPSQADVSINIYNSTGRLIRELVSNTQSMGNYKVEWDGRNNKGEAMPSGNYIYRIRAKDFKDTKRMLLLK